MVGSITNYGFTDKTICLGNDNKGVNFKRTISRRSQRQRIGVDGDVTYEKCGISIYFESDSRSIRESPRK